MSEVILHHEAEGEGVMDKEAEGADHLEFSIAPDGFDPNIFYSLIDLENGWDTVEVSILLNNENTFSVTAINPDSLEPVGNPIVMTEGKLSVKRLTTFYAMPNGAIAFMLATKPPAPSAFYWMRVGPSEATGKSWQTVKDRNERVGIEPPILNEPSPAPGPEVTPLKQAALPPFTPEQIRCPSPLAMAALAHAGFEIKERGKAALVFPDNGTRPHYLDGQTGFKFYADENLPDPTKALLAMDDLTVSAALIAMGTWFERNGGKGGEITKTRLHVKEVLDFRGTEKHHSGGYRREQKEAVAKDLRTLNDIWIEGKDTVYEQRGKKRVEKTVALLSRFLEVAYERELTLFGEGDPYAFRLAPGEWAKPFLEEPNLLYASILRPVMRYHPKKQNLEMRLGVYFTFQWRNRARDGNYSQSWAVATLWKGACKKPDAKHPARSRKALEDALDTLQADGVIASWQYERTNEGELWDAATGKEAHGWLQKWLKWTIQIDPPVAILEQYRDISKAAGKALQAAKAAAARKNEAKKESA